MFLGGGRQGGRLLQDYGDWPLEPPPTPKGTINADSNINLFLQDINITITHNRDLKIPIISLGQNFKITKPGVDISESRSLILSTTPHLTT